MCFILSTKLYLIKLSFLNHSSGAPTLVINIAFFPLYMPFSNFFSFYSSKTCSIQDFNIAGTLPHQNGNIKITKSDFFNFSRS